MKQRASILFAVGLVVLMVVLMARPIREESATVDEPIRLAASYAYGQGYGFSFDPEQPPLTRIISALPLRFMNATMPLGGQLLLQRRTGVSMAWKWSGEGRPVEELFPQGREDWYFWPHGEEEMLGYEFVYSGANDADVLLATGRWVQVLLTVLAGLVIFFWLRELSGPAAAVFGLALWVFNPIALAYGHLVLTDMGVTLFFTLAVWTFGRFLKEPTTHRAIICGVSCGGALAMKFTAFALAPVFLVLVVIWWRARIIKPEFWKRAPLIVVGAALLVLLVYAQYWSPAPRISPERAGDLGVPVWFQVLRPILIPPDFFKGVAVQMGQALSGHVAYFHGEWGRTGWWYYFPVALAIKTPLPLLLLTLGGFIFWVRGLRRLEIERSIPWVAVFVYFLLSLTSSIDVGVRYLLPMFPLVTVGIASQFAKQSRVVRIGGWVCCGWLVLVTTLAYPHFIEYFNECAGGPANGYKWLVDSNYDWGQDIKRLKQYLGEHTDKHVYLYYFGPPLAADYYGISYQFATPEEARGLTRGTIIVSSMFLVRPEWAWLRERQKPSDRIGYTLFVYQLGDSK